MAEHFYKLRVAEIVPETEDANSIRFELPHGLEDAFRFKAGQHVSVRAEIDGEEVRRNYSLCVAPDEGLLKVTVKRIKGGVFSNWVGDNLKVGDALDVMTPHGSFTVDFDRATTPQDHNTFGNGPHKCIGAPLARAEIEVFLQEFVGRMPSFRLDPDKRNVEHCGSVPGFDELYLRWD